MTAVSANYRWLRPEEVAGVAEALKDAWRDPEIPSRQFELAAGVELERFRQGQSVAPYDALLRLMKCLPNGMRVGSNILDAGASCGYYSEVIRCGGFFLHYCGIDFSEYFVALARKLYPFMDFMVMDARDLKFANSTFDIVLSSAVMMHAVDYERVLSEAVRVSRQYIILHRTPVLTSQPTSYFIKEAYGVPCLEVHFNESELVGLFAKYGLTVVATEEIFRHEDFGHQSYLLMKDATFHVSA